MKFCDIIQRRIPWSISTLAFSEVLAISYLALFNLTANQLLVLCIRILSSKIQSHGRTQFGRAALKVRSRPFSVVSGRGFVTENSYMSLGKAYYLSYN